MVDCDSEGGGHFLWSFGSIYIQKEAKGLEEDCDEREPKDCGVWFQDGDEGRSQRFPMQVGPVRQK